MLFVVGWFCLFFFFVDVFVLSLFFFCFFVFYMYSEIIRPIRVNNSLYYTHFEITDDSCNLIGSQQCDLFPNCTIFCSKSHPYLYPIKMEMK